ncbi:winged helix-turn-helix transcriptional regulator [Roseivivax sediminis]|uniref:DNA-binding transcriptional regulator, HxlR family n=1 Tax=Roseivivax sediminis TaxID=936889 RepID=A0A1I1UN30_9RHOB|nr:helix-turn-helix domain-containing protein [Roseivivax sediminis]SFD71048.1 DNA-binding transcriptional regulator, HxlR family [Roseivivax sediminis]
MPVQSSDDLEHIRSVLDVLTGKWSLLVLNALCDGPARFNALRRINKGVSQKALTECLRRLEANGLITRTVVSTSPVAVVYAVSDLGASLEPHLKGLLEWSLDHRQKVEEARDAFVNGDAARPFTDAGNHPPRSGGES